MKMNRLVLFRIKNIRKILTKGIFAIYYEYINYLRKLDKRVYDNKEDKRKVMRKYLEIVLKINQ